MSDGPFFVLLALVAVAGFVTSIIVTSHVDAWCERRGYGYWKANAVGRAAGVAAFFITLIVGWLSLGVLRAVIAIL